MNKLYAKLFSKHYSNVYMINFIMHMIDYSVLNLVEPQRYDLGCKIIGDLVHRTIMFLPTACQLLKGLRRLFPAMHWHVKKV